MTSAAPPLPRVAAFVLETDARRRLREALHGRARIDFVDTIGAVRTACAHVADAVIIDTRDGLNHSTAGVIRVLRAEQPALVILAYCRLGAPGNTHITDAVLAGAHELVFEGIDDAGVALRAKLQSAQYASVAETAIATLTSVLPSQVHTMIRFIVRNAGLATRVTVVANALGVHRKTLVNTCTRAGAPSPHTLIAWCRVAVAVEALSRSPKTIEAVALEMDFPSDTALRNMIKRHTGFTATQLRLDGGLRAIARLIGARLVIDRSQRASRVTTAGVIARTASERR